jgi:hypothetical protein
MQPPDRSAIARPCAPISLEMGLQLPGNAASAGL